MRKKSIFWVHVLVFCLKKNKKTNITKTKALRDKGVCMCVYEGLKKPVMCFFFKNFNKKTTL